MSAPGELIAQRYRLKRHVGAGGMGVVWEAFDERLHRTVALKQLHPQPWLSDADAELVTHRAMREARITARLNHPHAVPVYDVVEEQGRPCLVMQFLDSKPLSSVIGHGGALPEPEVAELGAQVAAALEAAHKVGIVHRDVKPGNVLVAQDGTARISDFGIAHALGDVTLTSTGLVAGTPEYLAPEVARGSEPGYPADVFSLGATLYAALEGRPPFGTDTNRIALLHRVAAGVVTVPQHNGPLASLLGEMLAAEPGARPTMSQVAARLARLCDTGRAPMQAPIASGAGLTTESTGPPPTVGRAARPGEDLPPTVGMPRSSSEDPAPTVGMPARPGADPPPVVGMLGGRSEGLAPTVGVPARLGEDLAPTQRQQTPQPQAAAPTTPSGTAIVTAPPLARPAGPAAEVTGSRRALPKDRRRRSSPGGRGRLVAVVVALLLLLVPLLLITQPWRGDKQAGSVPPVASSTPGAVTGAPTAPSTVAAAPPAATPSASAPASSPSAPSTATPAPAPAAAASAAPPVAVSGALTAADSVKAITSYYSLLPVSTTQAWPLMTASYQTNKAGGRQGYQRFWDTYSKVTATDVSAVGPSTVEATISYYAKDGRVTRERTSFGLVNDGGVVKIDSSRLLSTLG